ncbi:hypothetical protein D3C86_2160190 [compost metagenome]
MPLKFPLTVKRFRGVRGTIDACIIRDAAGRGINLPCDETEFRREVAKLFSPEEAEELAIRLRQAEEMNPHKSWLG